jgi:pullulanase/glycogen debranching enzyme
MRWFNEEGGNPDWNGSGRTLGCLIVPEQAEAPTENHVLCLLFNADTTETEFNLPPIPQDMGKWHLALDTALTPPEDILEQGRKKPLEHQGRYVLKGKSMVIAVS